MDRKRKDKGKRKQGQKRVKERERIFREIGKIYGKKDHREENKSENRQRESNETENNYNEEDAAYTSKGTEKKKEDLKALHVRLTEMYNGHIS